MSNRLTFLATLSLGVLILGVLVLRVQTALTRGIYHFDEAHNLIAAKTFRRLFEERRSIMSGQINLGQLKTQLRQEGATFPPEIAKPSYASLLALGALFSSDLAAVGNVLSVIATMLAAWIYYLSARALKIPFLESLLLATVLFVSPIINYYGVLSLAHGWAFAFLMVSLGAYLKHSMRTAAFFAGIALTTHYGTLPTVGVLMLALTLECFHETGRRKPRLCFEIIALFLLPACLYEVAYVLVKWGLADYWRDTHFRTYFEQFLFQVHCNSLSDNLSDIALYRRNMHVFAGMARTQGGLLTAFMLGSLLWAWIRVRSLELKSRVVLVAASVTLLFWMLNRGVVVSRVAMFILPGLYLVLAIVLKLWQTSFPNKPWMGRSLLLLIVSCSSYDSIRQNAMLKSPYPEAARYLSHMGYSDPIVDLSGMLLWQYYIGRRMSFDTMQAMTLENFKHRVLELIQQAGSPERIPFFWKESIWNRFSLNSPMRIFLQKLLRKTPVSVWKIPASQIDLYRFEDGEDHTEREPRDTLQLYWVKKSDFL